MSTKKTTENNESISKNIRFKKQLITAINQGKDDMIPFSAWVQRACIEKLERDCKTDSL